MLALHVLDLVGTVAFAVSGALKGVRRGMDIFGVAVLATVTAIGGGTARDLLLGIRAFWLEQPTYVLLSVAAALTVFISYRWVERGERLLLLFDAVGLGAFTAIGAMKAEAAGVGAVGVVTLACLTGVGGGVIRDVLARDVPIVLRAEIYASASILGAGGYLALNRLGAGEPTAIWGAAGITVVLRVLSILLRWNLPRHETGSESKEENL